MLACNLFTAWHKAFYEVDKRCMARGKPEGLRRPVVHLEVDVGVVIAPPRRSVVLIPNALEVCRETAGPTRCEQQIARILGQQCNQRWVGPLRRCILDTVGKWLFRRPAVIQIDCKCAEQATVLTAMSMSLCLPRCSKCGVYLRDRPPMVFMVPACREGNAEDDRICILDDQRVAIREHGSTKVLHTETGHELKGISTIINE